MWFDVVVLMAAYRAFQLLFRRRSKKNTGADGHLKLKVAKTFQEAYGGKIYQALRIPDTGHRGHQVIDMLLLTDKELYVFAIKDLSGTIKACSDGTWYETNTEGNAKTHPNAVMDLKERVAVLAQYIARRGVTLPETFFNLRVVFVNPSARPEQEILLQPEVLSYDRWEDFLKKGSGFFGRKANAFSASRNEDFSDTLHKQLHFILSTAPTWDRLELQGGGIVLGEFIRFKGQSQDLQALNVVKRSKISQWEAFHKSTFLSFLGIQDNSDVRVVCTLRDYRQGTAVQPKRIETQVKSDLEVIFQVEGMKKPQNFGIKDIIILSLRA